MFKVLHAPTLFGIAEERCVNGLRLKVRVARPAAPTPPNRDTFGVYL